jgi:hypothetical protein
MPGPVDPDVPKDDLYWNRGAHPRKASADAGKPPVGSKVDEVPQLRQERVEGQEANRTASGIIVVSFLIRVYIH